MTHSAAITPPARAHAMLVAALGLCHFGAIADCGLGRVDGALYPLVFDGCFHNSTGREDYVALLAALERRFSLARSVPLPDGSSLLVSRVPSPDAPVARSN
jgi:hypothetical protein